MPLRLRTRSPLSRSSPQEPTAGNLLNNTLFINLLPFPVSFPCFPARVFWRASKKVICTGTFVAGSASGGTQTQTRYFTEAPPAAWLSQASSMPSHVSQTPAPIVCPGRPKLQVRRAAFSWEGSVPPLSVLAPGPYCHRLILSSSHPLSSVWTSLESR